MSAGGAVAAAAAAALQPLALTGVYDGPPPRAAYPYAAVDAGSELDWSHKSASGREVLLAVTIWDDQPARLAGLADAAEAAVGAIGAVDGWMLGSLRFLRRRTVRDVAGPWAAALDFRVRLVAA